MDRTTKLVISTDDRKIFGNHDAGCLNIEISYRAFAGLGQTGPIYANTTVFKGTVEGLAKLLSGKKIESSCDYLDQW